MLLDLFFEFSFGLANIPKFMVIARYRVHDVGSAPNIRFRSSFKQEITKGCGFLVDTVDVERFLQDFEHFSSVRMIGGKKHF